MSFAGGRLRICQTNICQDDKGMYFFLCWSFGLEYISSGRPFQSSSLTRKAETSVYTCIFVGFPAASCASYDTGQTARHCALHRALMMDRLALVLLALLSDLFLNITLHKHFKYGVFIGNREPQQMRPRLACSISAAEGQEIGRAHV